MNNSPSSLTMSSDIWEFYGFQYNPFDTRALSPFSQTPLPIAQAFIPRLTDERATTVLANILASSGGMRLVVEGEIGVGKTTFVNYHRYLWHLAKERALFTTINEISLCPGWNVKDCLLNILANLLEALLQHRGEKFVKENKVFREILVLSKVLWESAKSFQGSVNLGFVGIGGGYGKQMSLLLPNMPEIQLLIYFQKMVEEIIKIGYRGVLLHLDNLELPSRSQPALTQQLFENLRDALQTSDVYSVVVGYKGFFYQIISPCERVRSVFFGYPITIAPLSLPEVLAVLEKRYELLAKNPNQFIRPVENELVEYLYQVYNGKIRFIMDAINSLVYQLSAGRVKTFSLKEGKLSLQSLIAEKSRQFLTPREWEILQGCLRLERFQNADLSRDLRISRQHVSYYLNRFLQYNLIYPELQEGNKIYYHLSEELQLIAQHNDPPKLPVRHHKTAALNTRQETAVIFLKRHGAITTSKYMELTKTSRATAQKDLAELLKNCLVIRQGITRNIHYVLVPE